jgi:glutaconyl-CoA/methylmalonyl-CoA decarboxylase subunit delta
MNFEDISWDFNRVLESDNGLSLPLIGYIIVFIALIMLYLVFQNLPKLVGVRSKKATMVEPSAAKEGRFDMNISGETNAAIGAALHLYLNELHDEENLTLTINKVSKRYTPWNSKIYGVIKDMNRKF